VLNSSIDGTDEVGMLLKYNPEKKIEFVKGDSSNLKITSPIDLIIASSLLEAK
jgi:2-C-methyl-D-erythritol 4-phosphate cytidylyltransferase